MRVPPNISQYYIYGECAFENMFIVMEQKDVALLSSHIPFFPPLPDGFYGKNQ